MIDGGLDIEKSGIVTGKVFGVNGSEQVGLDDLGCRTTEGHGSQRRG